MANALCQQLGLKGEESCLLNPASSGTMLSSEPNSDINQGPMLVKPRISAPSVVHVWAASLEVPASILARFQKLLSQDELSRASRYHFEKDRNRFVAARGWLRELLGACISIPPAALDFKYGPKGKPALADSVISNRLEFNLAHSENLALVAIAQGVPVGVDLERIRFLPQQEDLVTRFFSKREMAQFKSLLENQKSPSFFRLWTRKEAWLKATGEGIAHLLGQVEVSFLPGESARLLRLPDGFSRLSQWSLYDVVAKPCFVAAVAIPVPDVQIRFKRWEHGRMEFRL
jgi:4'-phosphopantetheinyl transferase